MNSAMLFFAHVRGNFAATLWPRLGEWFCAGMLVGLGWVSIVHPDLMRMAKSAAYNDMLSWAPQETWAYVFLVGGMLRLTVLLINGAWRRSPHYRATAAFLSCFFWWQITKSFYAVFGYAYILAAGIMFLDFANMIRAAGDAKLIDHAFEKGRRESERGN